MRKSARQEGTNQNYEKRLGCKYSTEYIQQPKVVNKAYHITDVTKVLPLSSCNKKPQKRSPPGGKEHCSHLHSNSDFRGEWHVQGKKTQISSTWFSMAFLFFGSLTIDSCNSAIFFILLSISIFWMRFLVWFLSSRTVSSFPCFFAKREAQAECMAVTQFSRSVWLEA